MSQDLLADAFLQSSIGDTPMAVKAEDVQQAGGLDFSKHFFEPKVGATYLIKFLPNPGASAITHRSVYKNLPDPTRKGKTFHYVSSGNAKTCKALELFFELHDLKKNQGDAIAEKKIDKYLGRTQQGCCKVQILSSPDASEVGMIRMFTFATFGPNATVANLLNLKLNPTKEQLVQGYEIEDVFNIFESAALSLVCEEATYDGVKGRDFTKSSWAPKKRGAIGVVDGKSREFLKSDLNEGKLSEECTPYFKAFAELATSADYDVYRYFQYKEIDDARNDKDTNDYLKSVQAKVEEIIPVIREKSLSEIAAYGKTDSSSTAKEKPDTAKETLKDSLPPELQDSNLVTETKTTETVTATVAETASSEVASILGED